MTRFAASKSPGNLKVPSKKSKDKTVIGKRNSKRRVSVEKVLFVNLTLSPRTVTVFLAVLSDELRSVKDLNCYKWQPDVT